MSTLSQSNANDLIKQTKNRLVAREIWMSSMSHDAPHSHSWHQLIFPHSGMLRTRTEHEEYYVTCNKAVLIPAGCQHESWAITPVRFIGVYVKPCELALFPTECRIVEVAPLYKALIIEMLNIGSHLKKPSSKEDRLISVFCDQTLEQAVSPFALILPQDKRLRALLDDLLQDLASKKTLFEWAKTVGASERTISRIFMRETGLSFRQWRQKLRLINALSLIEQRLTIQDVAMEVGYDSPSAFIYAFKKAFSVTPQQYFRQ